MIYDIYHDECKDAGYWHGFLFVPRTSREELLELMARARENVGYHHRLHYVSIGQATKPHHEKYMVAEAWTSIGCAALQQHKIDKSPPIVLLGKHPRTKTAPEYRVLTRLLRCKFVLLRERDTHKKMYASMTQLECIETTFRMAMKGGVHKLFNDAEQIQIGNVFIDGDEQYIGAFGRTFGVDRTLRRFAPESRNYVSFVDGPKLIPQRSDHTKIEKSQDPENSQLLQLCDVLIGGFRFHTCIADRNHPRFNISLPCKTLLDYEQENRARMAQSRYYNGFSLQQTWIENDEWRFAPLMTALATPPPIQRALFASAVGLEGLQERSGH